MSNESPRPRKKAPPRVQPAGATSVSELVAALGDLGQSQGEADDGATKEHVVAAPEGEDGPVTSSTDEPSSASGVASAEGPAGDEDRDASQAPAERDGPAARPGVNLVDALPMDDEDDLSNVEGEASDRLTMIVESLLFASTKPLSVKELRRVLSDPTPRQIQLALKKLIDDSQSRGVVCQQVAGGFVLRTHPDNAAWVQKLLQVKPVRLSRPQLETLAVVAYRQPITRPEIDLVRGVDSGATLKVLLERELVQIIGRKEEPGRPLLYGTTVKFLEFFNLTSLRDLPDLREFKELSSEAKAQLRREMNDDEIEALGQEVMAFAHPEGEPAVDESAVDELAVDESAVDEPSTLAADVDDVASAHEDAGEPEEPATEEPTAEEPATEEPATEESAVEEPAVEEPATEEPATEESAVEEPAVEEPATEEPATEEPATEEQETT